MTFPSRRTAMAAASVSVIAASFLAACGGGDGGDSASGTDEDYVAIICKAGAEFASSIDKAQDEALAKALADVEDLTDEAAIEKVAAKVMAEPVEAFAKAISNAKAPADVKDYHNSVVTQLKTAVKELNAGNVSALDALGDFATPPEAVGNRLQAIAEKNADCQAAQFSFE